MSEEELNKEAPNSDLGADLPPAENEDIINKENPEQQDDKENPEDKQGQEEQKEENDFFGKPETYDYTDVKFPEGMQLDENMANRFNEYASKLNLSQKSANDMMAMAVELTEQTQKQTVEAMGKLQEAKIEGYKVLLNRDSEIGGARLKESLVTANVAYDGFFQDEDLRTIIAEAGLNVHPKFIKALKAIGSQMQNDKVHTGGQVPNKQSREDILYPTMDENKE